MRCHVAGCISEDFPDLPTLNTHRKTVHPEIEAERMQKLNAARAAKHSGKTRRHKSPLKPASDNHRDEKPTPTEQRSHVNFIMKPPVPVTITSHYLNLAREVAVQRWGWDPRCTMSQFLDTFIYLVLKERGAIPYVVLFDENEEEGEDNGNGHRTTRGSDSGVSEVTTEEAETGERSESVSSR